MRHLFPWAVKPPSSDPNLLEIQSGRKIVGARYQSQFSEIRTLSGVGQSSFDLLYAPAIYAVADHVQHLPASEHHHHSYAGGLMKHILDAAIYSLRLRRGYQLPTGSPPEVIRTLADLYTYVVFCGVLCHDIAKPAVDIKVALYDRKGNSIGDWNPYRGPMAANAKAAYYSYRYVEGRSYRLHNLASGLFVPRIIPPEGLKWISSNMEVFTQFMYFVTGNYEDAGEIAKIISQGDQSSVSTSLGAQTIPGAGHGAIPLHDKIRTSIRHIFKDEETILNKPGAVGWFDGTDCWVMSKVIADKVREQLTSEGHTGIPGDNSRLFTIMIEHGLITPTTANKAIWKIKVELQGWTPKNEFSVLRIPSQIIWPNAEARPDGINGSVSVAGELPVETSDEESPKQEPLNQQISAQSTTDSQPSEEERESKETPVNIEDEDTSLGLAAMFLVDNEDTPKTSSEVEEATKPTEIPDHPGTAFLFWLRDGIKNKTIRYNGAKHQVHIVEKGVFLVSPQIFKVYADTCGADWEAVQKSFQGLKINLKNISGENWHKVRVSGKTNKISTVTGWILPIDEIFGSGSKPPINNHLTMV